MANMSSYTPDYSGYRAILKSAKVQALLNSKAQNVASSADGMLSSNDGYYLNSFEVKDFTTKSGGTGKVVRTKTDHARYSQAKNKTLTKALKGCK